MGFNKDTDFFLLLLYACESLCGHEVPKKYEVEGLFEFQTAEVCCIRRHCLSKPATSKPESPKRCHFSFHADRYRGQASVTAN